MLGLEDVHIVDTVGTVRWLHQNGFHSNAFLVGTCSVHTPILADLRHEIVDFIDNTHPPVNRSLAKWRLSRRVRSVHPEIVS